MQKFAAAYEHMLTHNGVRGWNLAQCFFVLAGEFEPGDDSPAASDYRVRRYALEKYLQDVTPASLDAAERLLPPLSRGDAVVLQRALGICDADDLLLGAAIGVYLHDGDSILGGWSKRLDGLLRGFPWESQGAAGVALDRACTRVATAGDESVRVWEMRAGDVEVEMPPRRVAGAAASPRRVAVAVDRMGKPVVAWADNSQVMIGPVDAAAPPRVLPKSDEPIVAVALSPNGEDVAVGDRQGQVHVMSLTSDPAGTWLAMPNGGSEVVAVALAAGARAVVAAWADGRVRIRVRARGAAGSPVDVPWRPADGGSLRPTAVALSHDGKRLAVGRSDGSVALLDLANHPLVRPLPDIAPDLCGPVRALGLDGSGTSLVLVRRNAVLVRDAERQAAVPLEKPGASSRPRLDWIERARRQMLEQLRGSLLRHGGFTFDSTAGPRKPLIAACSHQAREAMVFATAATVCGPDPVTGMAALRAALAARNPVPPIPLDQIPPECHSILRGPLLASLADLTRISWDEDWARRGGAGAAGRGRRPAGREDTEAAAQRAFDAAALDHWNDEQRAAENELEEPDAAVDAPQAGGDRGGGSRWPGMIVNMRPHVLLHEAVLRCVAQRGEASAEFLRCGKETSGVQGFFRLRYAAQVWSYLDERSFTAAQRDELVALLEGEFAGSGDPLTGDALRALGELKGNDRWGASHDRLLTQFVDECIRTRCERRSAAPGDWCKRVRETLDALRRTPCPLAAVEELVSLQTAGDWVELLCVVLEMQRAVPAGLPARGKAAVALQFEILEGHLLAGLLEDPRGALAALLAGLEKLPHSPALPDPLDVTSLQILKGQTMRAWAGYCSRRAIRDPARLTASERRWADCVRVLDYLADELKNPSYREVLAGRPAIDRERVIGFFTQLYAPNQQAGVRTWAPDEWEYLAYRLAFVGGPRAYGEIHRRVAAASCPPAARDLICLYRFLRECTQVLDDLRVPFGKCACAAEAAGEPS